MDELQNIQEILFNNARAFKDGEYLEIMNNLAKLREKIINIRDIQQIYISRVYVREEKDIEVDIRTLESFNEFKYNLVIDNVNYRETNDSVNDFLNHLYVARTLYSLLWNYSLDEFMSTVLWFMDMIENSHGEKHVFMKICFLSFLFKNMEIYREQPWFRRRIIEGSINQMIDDPAYADHEKQLSIWMTIISNNSYFS